MMLFMVKKKQNIISGIIHIHHRGFGFVTPHKGSELKEDIFIPQRKTLTAVEGDEVEVRYDPTPTPKGWEGEVLAILKRGRESVAGTLASKLAPNLWSAYIPLFGPEKEMIVSTSASAKQGDRMIFEVTSWGNQHKAAKGKATTFLGEIVDGTADVPAAVEEFHLRNSFPQEIENELAAFTPTFSSKELKNRVDFTKLETFTIDPDESKDFDDALSLVVEEEGYTLYVHVADVSHYVKAGSFLDQEAKARCNSVYLPGHVLPMLPHALSSDLCSLKPKVKRLTVTVIVQLDREGKVKEYRVVKSIIKSKKRFTYREAKEVLDGKKKSVHKKTLEQMVTLCHLLKQERAKRGAVEFAMPDLSVKVNKEGDITAMEIVEYDITHQMVEEFMLKANELVALTLYEQNKPLTYRIHEEPSPDKLRDFVTYARSFGFALSSQPTHEELQQLFDKTREQSFGKALMTAFIRTMKLASYSTQNIGHFGLMLDHYTHFTSPIRRYVDLIVHRLLFDEVNLKEDQEQMALQCSEKERASARAESSVTQLKKLRYLLKQVEETPDLVFTAIITAIKPFGISFEIPSLFMDGFLPIEELEGRPVFYKKRKKLSGHDSQYVTGATIEIQPLEISLIRRSVLWTIKKTAHTKKNKKKSKNNNPKKS